MRDDTASGEPGVREPSSEQLLQAIHSHGVFAVDAAGAITAWSDSAVALYGMAPREVVGDHLRTLLADRGDPAPDVDAVLADVEGGTSEIEHWNRRADGTVFWATMALSPLEDDALDGSVVVSRDTTARKQYEQMLERQNDRLKEFTDIIAHDLRNPLNVIDGRLTLLRDTGDTEHIDHIAATTERMERLVDDLLRVARQGEVVTDPAPSDLQSVVETAWEGIAELPGEASLVYDPVGTVAADHDRVCSLFENLFRNAVEHAVGSSDCQSPHGSVEQGTVDVTVRVGPLPNGFFVEDDGPGIPADRRDRVFDHGFTTAEDGSGYGLSVVRTIANAHGWDVTATAGSSGGARFEVTGVEFVG